MSVAGAVVALRARGTGLFGCGARTREGAAILAALQQLVDAVNSDKPGLSSVPKGVSLGESSYWTGAAPPGWKKTTTKTQNPG